jgi:hypothetical protein
MPREERAVIWVRAQIEKNVLRIPPLPPDWISGKGESVGREGKIPSDETRSEPALVSRPETPGVGNGHAGGGQGVSITSPLPKTRVDYHCPQASRSMKLRHSSQASSKRRA